MLRPGRLEVHVEVGLPGLGGREEILQIHTRQLAAAGALAEDVDLQAIARTSPNFSGAELEGLVRAATAAGLHSALAGAAGGGDQSGAGAGAGEVMVRRAHFDAALREVTPAFGTQFEDLPGQAGPTGRGLLPRSCPVFTASLQSAKRLAAQVASSQWHPRGGQDAAGGGMVVSCLLHGARGSGTSSVASAVAASSGYPFVQVLSAAAVIGPWRAPVPCAYVGVVVPAVHVAARHVRKRV